MATRRSVILRPYLSVRRGASIAGIGIRLMADLFRMQERRELGQEGRRTGVSFPNGRRRRFHLNPRPGNFPGTVATAIARALGWPRSETVLTVVDSGQRGKRPLF